MKEGLAPTALDTQVLAVPKGKQYYIELTYVTYVQLFMYMYFLVSPNE